MRTIALAFAILLLGPASAGAAQANVVSSVDVADQGGASTVSIRVSGPPSFTTFTLVDPPRFVVDVSDATFGGDRRKVRLELTAKGRALYPKIVDAQVNLLNRLLQGFTRPEAAQLEELLSRLLANG